MGAIQWRNTSESLLDGGREKVQAANLPWAEDGFHLRPHCPNGVEIRTVGRKIQHAHALFLQNLPNCFHMVRTHIVHYYDVTRLKSWKQNLFQILDKTFSRCPALIGCKRLLPIQTNGRQDSRCLLCIQRGVIHCPLGREHPSI